MQLQSQTGNSGKSKTELKTPARRPSTAWRVEVLDILLIGLFVARGVRVRAAGCAGRARCHGAAAQLPCRSAALLSAKPTGIEFRIELGLITGIQLRAFFSQIALSFVRSQAAATLFGILFGVIALSGPVADRDRLAGIKAEAMPAMARAGLALMLAVMAPAVDSLLKTPVAWQGSKLGPVRFSGSGSWSHMEGFLVKRRPNFGLLSTVRSNHVHRQSHKVNRPHRQGPVLCSLSLADGVTDIVERVAPSVALVLPVGVRNSTAQGSGFAISHDGKSYLLTSAHVAAGGFKISVSLPQDDFVTKYEAELVGRAADSRIDLALLKLPEVGCTHAEGIRFSQLCTAWASSND
eukprot:6183898-Pleurochrysis_carterae.AAC.5